MVVSFDANHNNRKVVSTLSPSEKLHLIAHSEGPHLTLKISNFPFFSEILPFRATPLIFS